MIALRMGVDSCRFDVFPHRRFDCFFFAVFSFRRRPSTDLGMSARFAASALAIAARLD
jgi:hypothetical protein